MAKRTKVSAALATVLPPSQRGLAKSIEALTVQAIWHLCTSEGRAVLPGLGTFELRQRRARLARNPRTGEQFTYPATTVLRFKLDKQAKQKLNAA